MTTRRQVNISRVIPRGPAPKRGSWDRYKRSPRKPGKGPARIGGSTSRALNKAIKLRRKLGVRGAIQTQRQNRRRHITTVKDL